jgi:hypothetical protein
MEWPSTSCLKPAMPSGGLTPDQKKQCRSLDHFTIIESISPEYFVIISVPEEENLSYAGVKNNDDYE